MNPAILAASDPPKLETPETRPEEPRSADRGSTWISVFVSVVLHANLLLLLALTFRALHEEERPAVIDTTLTPGEAQDSLKNVEMPAEVDLAKDEALFAEEAPKTAVELMDVETRKPDLSGVFGKGGTGGIGGGGGPGGGVGFFGTRASGKSFVFVVDCSGSMQGPRFARARSELRKSLRQLEPDQEFQIVFFNDQPVPLRHSKYGDRLIPAARTELAEVYRWIDRRRAHGATVPDEALRRALELRPDVIFFLTDAQSVPRTVRTLIAEENAHRSIVHTIAFGHKGGETLMQGIAADHHGRYRFVP